MISELQSFAFSSDKDPLDQTKRQAGEPIDFGAERTVTHGPCLEIPARLLATQNVDLGILLPHE
jgi:hypothetical protein